LEVNQFLLISFLIPPLGFPLGLYGLWTDFTNWRKYILCIALSVFSFAYCYDVYTLVEEDGPDWSRYRLFVREIQNKTLLDAWSDGYEGSLLYGFVSMAWIVAQIGDFNLLPAVTTSVTYYIALYVACKIADDYSVPHNNLFLWVIFLGLTLNFGAIVSNIRNVFSLALTGFAVFRDLYEHKKNWTTFFLYLFPVSVHPAAFAVWFARGIVPIVRFFYIPFAITAIIVGPMTEWVSEQLSYLNIESNNVLGWFVKQSIEKLNWYFNDNFTEWAVFVHNDVYENVTKLAQMWVVFVLMVSIVLAFQKLRIQTRFTANDLDKINNFLYVICLLTVSCWPIWNPIYWRFAALAIVMGSVIFLPVLQFGGYWQRRIVLSVYFSTPFIFCIWAKNMLMVEKAKFLFGPFVSSPLIISIIDLLQHFGIVE